MGISILVADVASGAVVVRVAQCALHNWFLTHIRGGAELGARVVPSDAPFAVINRITACASGVVSTVARFNRVVGGSRHHTVAIARAMVTPFGSTPCATSLSVACSTIVFVGIAVVVSRAAAGHQGSLQQSVTIGIGFETAISAWSITPRTILISITRVTVDVTFAKTAEALSCRWVSQEPANVVLRTWVRIAWACAEALLELVTISTARSVDALLAS